MRDRLKLLPNVLSGTRLLLLLPLWVLALGGQVEAVGWGLVLAGATDVLDGWLARRLDAATAAGAQLDSLADNLLAPSGAAWLVMLRPDLVDALWTPLFLWLCFYLAFLGIGWIRFRRFGNLHLWSAKVAAVAQYVFVVHAFLVPGISLPLFATAFTLTMVSLLEGLAYQVSSSDVDEHAGSLLLLLARRGTDRRGGTSAPPAVNAAGIGAHSRTERAA